MVKPSIILNKATIYTPLEIVLQGTIVIEGGKISYLGKTPPPHLPSNARQLSLPDCLITPGLIDLHMHGAQGIDFTTTAPQEWGTALKYHTAQGTTSFLATLMSAPHSQLLETIQQMAAYFPHQETNTAQCLGIHMEGPYLNPQKKGVHQTACLRPPSMAQIQKYLNTSNTWLKLLTIAPELDPRQEIIRALVKQGLVIAAGHSTASYDVTQQAIQAGLSYAVHIGNAMSVLHQRKPGILGALLENERVYCEVIADGVHLHPNILKLFYKLKGAQKLVLATDSSPLAGLPEGQHQWQEQIMQVRTGQITNFEDKLAGSCLTMAQAVKNMVKWNNCSFSEGLEMATTNPARVLGLDNKGELNVGMDADLVVFKADLTVKLVIVGGKIVWP